MVLHITTSPANDMAQGFGCIAYRRAGDYHEFDYETPEYCYNSDYDLLSQIYNFEPQKISAYNDSFKSTFHTYLIPHPRQ
jgi:hypothetical protein